MTKTQELEIQTLESRRYFQNFVTFLIANACKRWLI